jgi:hypothetical protein
MLSSAELLSSDNLVFLDLKDKNILCTATEVALWCSAVLCLVYIVGQIGLSVAFTQTHRMRVFEIRGAGKCFPD